MRAILLGFGILAVMAAAQVQSASAATAPRPWCVRDGSFGRGSWDCTYHTFQQCLASASGNGGSCEQNPNYRGPQKQPRRSRERRY
jgi:Protein of unknown function (DUF3551)